MNCRETREILTQDFPSRLDSRRAEAQRHLTACRLCRSHLQTDKALRRRLQRLEPEQPSVEFKEGLFDELAKARRQTDRKRRRVRVPAMIGAACFALLVVVLTWAWWQRDPSIRLAEYLIEDHQQTLPGRSMMSSSSPGEIEKWFEGKVDFPLRVRVPKGAEILGARLCRVGDKRAALIFYQAGSRPISWFTFPEAGSRELNSRVMFRQGYNLLMWNDRGLTHAVVSDLGLEILQEMARSTGAELPFDRD